MTMTEDGEDRPSNPSSDENVEPWQPTGWEPQRRGRDTWPPPYRPIPRHSRPRQPWWRRMRRWMTASE